MASMPTAGPSVQHVFHETAYLHGQAEALPRRLYVVKDWGLRVCNLHFKARGAPGAVEFPQKEPGLSSLREQGAGLLVRDLGHNRELLRVLRGSTKDVPASG